MAPSTPAVATVTEKAVSGDMRLAAAVLRKDRKATAEFVALYSDSLYAYLRRRLIPRPDLADDLLQEVFLAAWRSLEGYQGDAPLKSWLMGIAHHKVQEHYRRRLREPLEVDEDEAPTKLAVNPPIERELDQERFNQKVQAVLESLPENYSTALLWRYWEKCPAKEMAEKTGKTVKAVERLLARARRQFKRRWQDE